MMFAGQAVTWFDINSALISTFWKHGRKRVLNVRTAAVACLMWVLKRVWVCAYGCDRVSVCMASKWHPQCRVV